MALDLGGRRIGIAVSDPLGITAQPRGVVERKSRAQVLELLVQKIAEEDVDTLVVGLPLHMSGEAGEAARDARAFAEALRARRPELEVILWDERLTSVEAERRMREAGVGARRRKARVDTLAATLILASYLDARRSKPPAGG